MKVEDILVRRGWMLDRRMREGNTGDRDRKIGSRILKNFREIEYKQKFL